jgi:hypothetical protein
MFDRLNSLSTCICEGKSARRVRPVGVKPCKEAGTVPADPTFTSMSASGRGRPYNLKSNQLPRNRRNHTSVYYCQVAILEFRNSIDPKTPMRLFSAAYWAHRTDGIRSVALVVAVATLEFHKPVEVARSRLSYCGSHLVSQDL